MSGEVVVDPVLVLLEELMDTLDGLGGIEEHLDAIDGGMETVVQTQTIRP